MKNLLFSVVALLLCFYVSAQIVNIPDANFKAKLLAANPSNDIAKDINGNYIKIDANNDSEIQLSEANQIGALRVGSSFINSLEGIKSFTNLYSLYCGYQSIPTLDVSGLTKLYDLQCYYCNMTSLNISGLTSLLYLQCQNNNLTSLDLTGFLSLNYFNCESNEIATLNLTGLPNLQTLRCGRNKLTALDLNGSGLLNLSSIDCAENKLLTSLNVSALPNLAFIYCNGVNVPTLNLSGMTKLTGLDCVGSGVNTLNLNGLSNLQFLNCGGNNFTTLDLPSFGVVNLQYLNCDNNKSLTKLNVSGLANLIQFSFVENQNLQELYCSGNKLTSLNLTNLPNLITLDCSLNSITSLDVSELTNLQNLNCSGNQVQTLNTNDLTKLQSLNCSNNQLKALFIKNGTTEGSLNFAGNPGLLFVCADPSQVSSVQSLITSYGYTSTVGSDCSLTGLDFVIIPDLNLKGRLITEGFARNLNGEYFKIDANNDSEIQVSEALQVSYLDLGSADIQSLEGISNFKNLESLYGGYNSNITKLNLTGLTNLKTVFFPFSGIKVLNLDGLTSLESLNLENSSLTTLDLSNFKNLLDISCGSSPFLTSLNINGLTKLVYLFCSNNVSLTTLNASGCTSLKTLYCVDNINLKELRCSNTQLTGLTLTNLPNLITLECAFSQITLLDVSALGKLENLNCSDNQLKTLDLNYLPKLQSLNCANNQLTSLYINNGTIEGTLNLAGNAGLLYVCSDTAQIANVKSLVTSYGYTNCVVDDTCLPPASEIVTIPDAKFKALLISANASNFIAVGSQSVPIVLDVNGDSEIQLSEALRVVSLSIQSQPVQSLEGIKSFTNLNSLYITGNPITTLDVSGLTKLFSLTCSNNQISNLNVSGVTNLFELRCENNNLTTLEISNLQSFYYLICNNNKLTTLNLNNVPHLSTLACSSNNLTTVNINPFLNLNTLDCSNNKLQSLYIKKIFYFLDPYFLNISGNPGLAYVCADPSQIAEVKAYVDSNGYTNCVVDAACGVSSTGIIFFPDTNFKAKLLAANSNNKTAKDLNGDYFKIDANSDSEIDVTEALQVSYLDISNLEEYSSSNIISLEGILNFKNLSHFDCSKNSLVSFYIKGLTNMEVLRISNCQVGKLDLSDIPNLKELHCSVNGLSTLNLEAAPNLEILHCSENYFTTIDASSLRKLKQLDCSYNYTLTSLFVKNGVNEVLEMDFNPSLQFICADDSQIPLIEKSIIKNDYKNCTVNTYCTFNPGGIYYSIHGNNRLDVTGDGCDINDLAVARTKFTVSTGSSVNTTIADASGAYSISVEEGNHIITPILENPNFFTVSPSSVNVSFPSQISPLDQNFCYTAKGIHPDLEIMFVPGNSAVPGYGFWYNIVLHNKGNQIQSGSVILEIDSGLNAISSSKNLTWNFADLKPFESRQFVSSFLLGTPGGQRGQVITTFKAGDVLNFVASITSVGNDETPLDNAFTFSQTVLNSFDPNDKVCLEGNTIAPSKVGDYLHYVIHFENTGNHSAQNIVVKDLIDTEKFDVSSLIPMSGSHPFVTRISDGNKVEFIFENIKLPFDDANNDGYVAFKIKSLSSLALGNTLSNTASIYFDYNSPVDTNTATTAIAALAKQDFVFSNYLTIYPNPVKDILNIAKTESIEIRSISIYSVLGQVITVIPNAQDISKVDVSHLSAGIYFIKIDSDRGISNTKFIKK